MPGASAGRVRPGFSLIELLVVVAIATLLIGLVLAAVQRVRATAARTQCLNNARQLALGLHGYHGAHRTLPPGHTSTAASGPYNYLGWQARTLPFLEQQPLWGRVEDAFRMAPGDDFLKSPHAEILSTVVPAFGCPTDSRVSTPQFAYETRPVALTSYLGVGGVNYARRDGVLYADSVVRFADITDGTSQTLLFGERPPPPDFQFGWWYRGWGQNKEGSVEMVLGVHERNILGSRYPCPQGPYSFGTGRTDNQCDMFHFWSPHPGGAHFAFADGSVRFLRYSADEIMPALATRAGGESVSPPE